MSGSGLAKEETSEKPDGVLLPVLAPAPAPPAPAGKVYVDFVPFVRKQTELGFARFVGRNICEARRISEAVYDAVVSQALLSKEQGSATLVA